MTGRKIGGLIGGTLAFVSGCGPGTVAQEAPRDVVLPEVVVTAPSPIVPRRPPAAVTVTPQAGTPVVDTTFVPLTVVTPQELARSTGATLGDVLFTKPGVTATTFAPNAASRPVIRGLDNFRVRIQENGISAMDVSDLGEDHGVPIDPLAARQIEVIRGPATLRYGSQAIGGVVNVSNNRIPDTPAPPGMRLETKGAVSSVDHGLEGAALLDASAPNFAIHADIYRRNGHDYRTPLGIQRNSAFRSAGEALGGAYIFDNGFAGLAVSHFSSLYHVPGVEAAEGRTRIDMDQIKVTGKGEVRPASSAVDAVRYWIGATHYRHFEKGIEGGMDGTHATFRNREQEGRVEVQFAPVGTWLGPMITAIGVQGGHQRLATSGEAGELLLPNRTTNAAAYVFNELALTDTLKLQAAGRIESVGVRGTAALFPPDFLPTGVEPPEVRRDRHFVPISASLGLLKELPGGMVASLTGQYVQRAPRALELFAKGGHHASETFEIGDPNLRKEVAQTIEAGLKRSTGSFRFEANAYHTRYQGFIYKRLTGIECGHEFDECGVETEFDQVVFSQRNAHFTGAELLGQLDLGPVAGGVFGVDGQFDVVRARFDNGENVPRIPPVRVGGGVFWRDANWFARVGLLHAFAQTKIGTNETPTPGYNLLKAELAYTATLPALASGPREVALGITGDNLLNDRVRNHVSFKKDEVLLPGRNVRVFARVVF